MSNPRQKITLHQQANHQPTRKTVLYKEGSVKADMKIADPQPACDLGKQAATRLCHTHIFYTESSRLSASVAGQQPPWPLSSNACIVHHGPRACHNMTWEQRRRIHCLLGYRVPFSGSCLPGQACEDDWRQHNKLCHSCQICNPVEVMEHDDTTKCGRGPAGMAQIHQVMSQLQHQDLPAH
jgi:hypothetical protein